MILTNANFNRIKNEPEYKEHFSDYLTLEAFDKHIEETLETKNINILINNIIRIMSIINDGKEDTTHLEIKELILKANLSQNRNNFENTLNLLDKNADEKMIKLNRIIDKNLLTNLDKKINLLIKLEKLSKFFYPNFLNKLVMKKFEEEDAEVTNSKPSQKKELNIKDFHSKLSKEDKEKLLDFLLKDLFPLLFNKIKKIISTVTKGKKNDTNPS